jgi:small subunit ribosomal protein S8
MTMTDPIADMLTRLRNANSAYHDSVSMPSSKIKLGIAEILKQEGYIADWSVADAEVGKALTLSLKFGPSRERSIAGVRRVSKPGLRVYAKSTEIPKDAASAINPSAATGPRKRCDGPQNAPRQQALAGALRHPGRPGPGDRRPAQPAGTDRQRAPARVCPVGGSRAVCAAGPRSERSLDWPIGLGTGEPGGLGPTADGA